MEMEQLLMERNHEPRLSQGIEVWRTHSRLRLSLHTRYSACVHLFCLPQAFLGTLITEWTPMSEWDPLLCGDGGGV